MIIYLQKAVSIAATLRALKVCIRVTEVSENCRIRYTVYDFLSVCHCNSSMLYHFRVIWHWRI